MANKNHLLMVDKRRNESIHAQLMHAILHLAQSTSYDNSVPLPGINDLAVQLGIGVDVVADTYSKLITINSLIELDHKYYFKPFVFSTTFYSKIVSIYDQIIATGMTPSFRIIEQNSTNTHQSLPYKNGFDDLNFAYSRRVFYADATPVIVYDSYLNNATVDSSKININRPIYQQLSETLNIQLHYSPRHIRAVKLSDENCDLLQLPRGSVGMKVTAEVFNEKNQLIEVLVGYSTPHYRILF